MYVMYVRSLKSLFVVLIQFICLGVLFINVNWDALKNPFLVVIQVTAWVIIAWAFVTLRMKVNVFPDVATGAKLVMTGPYHFVRHPIYSGLLLYALAWALAGQNHISVLVFTVLTVDLLYKTTIEEKFLESVFFQYHDYKQRTKRLIPFVL